MGKKANKTKRMTSKLKTGMGSFCYCELCVCVSLCLCICDSCLPLWNVIQEERECLTSSWPSIDIVSGFPAGASGKDPACQCRRHKRQVFSPWVGRIPWRRAWQPTSIFMPGDARGQSSLAGYSPWGSQRIRHDWATKHSTAWNAITFIFKTVAF